MAEADSRMTLCTAMQYNNVDKVKAILIAHANRLSNQVKVEAQNWLDEKSK